MNPDVYRVTCTDGLVLEPVEAWMSGQGGVRVWRQGVRVADLPPSYGCAIARLESAPLPYVDPGPPEALLWVLGAFAIAAAGGTVAGGVAAARIGVSFGGFMPPAPPFVPPPPRP